MASEAQIKQKLLADELAKPYPDADIVYHLRITRNYWNTIDLDKSYRGAKKVQTLIGDNSLQAKLEALTGQKEE